MAPKDTVLTLKAARQIFSCNPSLQTVRRWCARGVYCHDTDCYVVLESFKIGGRRYTSTDKIREFIRLTNSILN